MYIGLDQILLSSFNHHLWISDKKMRPYERFGNNKWRVMMECERLPLCVERRFVTNWPWRPPREYDFIYVRRIVNADRPYKLTMKTADDGALDVIRRNITAAPYEDILLEPIPICSLPYEDMMFELRAPKNVGLEVHLIRAHRALRRTYQGMEFRAYLPAWRLQTAEGYFGDYKL